MAFRIVACCAILSMGIAQSTTAAVAACEGRTCSPPLQLSDFMRKSFAPSAATAPSKHAARQRAVKKQTSNKPAAKKHVREPRRSLVAHRRPLISPPLPKPMPAEAASSYAAQPPPSDVQDVQVVASDEFNDIDRAAGPALPWTSGDAGPAASGVQLVQAREYNDIDRVSNDSPPASFTEPARQQSTPAPTPASQTSWGDRMGATLHGLWAAIISGWQYLFG